MCGCLPAPERSRQDRAGAAAQRLRHGVRQNAFGMNTVSRPKNAATTPPTDAPISRFTDHVAADRVFATRTSPSAAMLGITELRAGSKNAAIVVSANSKG